MAGQSHDPKVVHRIAERMLKSLPGGPGRTPFAALKALWLERDISLRVMEIVEGGMSRFSRWVQIARQATEDY